MEKTLEQTTLENFDAKKSRVWEKRHVKMPEIIARLMKENFIQNTAELFKKKNIKFKDTYHLSIDNLEDILWVMEEDEDKYDEIRIYFTHYNDEFGGIYNELKDYENSLCMIYSRALKKTEIKQYQVVYSFNNEVEMKEEHFRKLQNKFSEIFKPVVAQSDVKSYTNYIIVPKVELLAYFAKILLYNKNNNRNKIKNINVCLAETITKIQLDNIEPLERINKDELQKRVFEESQLTVIFDAIDENNKLVSNLSYYDMNSLCPNQCP